MDASETYIRMADTPEIQGQAEWTDNEYVARKDTHEVIDRVFEYQYMLPNLIWLPRQDQLQAMIEGNHLTKFGKLYRSVVAMELYPSDSMEQLWLAFVMHEKYNKVWTGTEWRQE